MAAKLASPSGGSRYSLGTSADMNVTPMVDVMLVLLIIFMVAAPLATVSIKLDLPPATPPPPNAQKPKPPTVISVQQSGDLFIGGQHTTLATLGGDVTRALASPHPQEETVYIRADNEVKYSDFMAVLNALQDGGFFHISLITEDRTG
ncbi:MAG: biopolymer transporter ExbD [Caulobacteraceae bacterium]|nr:biopolymer transporter ExbD [Caulobacter sp.]